MFYCHVDTPIGGLLLGGDDEALSMIAFPAGPMRRSPDPAWIFSERPFEEVKRQLAAYFDGSLQLILVVKWHITVAILVEEKRQDSGTHRFPLIAKPGYNGKRFVIVRQGFLSEPVMVHEPLTCNMLFRCEAGVFLPKVVEQHWHPFREP